MCAVQVLACIYMQYLGMHVQTHPQRPVAVGDRECVVKSERKRNLKDKRGSVKQRETEEVTMVMRSRS